MNRKNPVAKAVRSPLCRPRVERDRTKYRRREKHSRW